jgi:hypothetical protein
MGTRGLTVVKINGEIKVAQYGQWDHYPDGQGVDILETLKGIIDAGEMENFKTKVRALRWLTKDEIEGLNDTKDWPEKHPYLSRDTGGQILSAIQNGTIDGKKMPSPIMGLVNRSDFMEDGLFCEGVFEVDLDAGTYTACGKSFPLSDLPTEEAFLQAFEQDEDE